MKKKKMQLGRKELTWYVISGIIALAGLTVVVFGIVGDHLPVISSENWILVSENAWLKNWSGMGYRYWGLILLGIAAVIASIALTHFARSGDRDSERAARRAQRLALDEEEVKEVEEVASK